MEGIASFSYTSFVGHLVDAEFKYVESKATPTFKISQQALVLLQHYNVSSLKKGRVLNFIDINKQWPWGYFERTCQGPNNNCGIGFI
jgi:hypothetical protein